MKTLVLGAGKKLHEGATHCDRVKLPGIDVVHNLEVHPWPFKTSSFERIIAEDVIEHLTDVVKAMEEIHRTLKFGGYVYIRTTHWQTENSFRDPTHKHFFTLESFDFFCPNTPIGQQYGWYSDVKFRKIGARRDGQEIIVELETMKKEKP